MWQGPESNEGCVAVAIVSDLCLSEQDLFLLSGTYAVWDDKQNRMHLKTLSCTSCGFHVPTQPLSIQKILWMCPLDLAQVPAAPSVPSLGEDTLEITSQLCPLYLPGEKMIRDMGSPWTVAASCSGVAGPEIHSLMETVFLGFFLSRTC